MFLENRLIAHRGIFDNKRVFENTFEAFDKAIEKGYTIELDVRLSRDKWIIVYHDDNYKRLLGIDLDVNKAGWADINRSSKFYIPTFKQALNHIAGRVPIIVEIKNEGAPSILEDTVCQFLRSYRGEFAIQSFNPRVLLYYRKIAPEYVRGQLAYSFNDSDNKFKKYLKNMSFNWLTKPTFISYKYDELESERLEKLRKKYIVLGWTVTSKREYNKYKDKYDNLICEDFINRKEHIDVKPKDDVQRSKRLFGKKRDLYYYDERDRYNGWRDTKDN